MELAEFLQVVGVVVACSWGAWSIESAPALHPIVKRGAQVGFVVLAGSYLAQRFGLL